MNNHRLYRCGHDRQLAGVAAGIGEYLDVDPTVIRVLWIVAAFLSGGLAILAYIVLALVMPVEPLTSTASAAAPPDGTPVDVAGGWVAPAHRHADRARGEGRLGLVLGVGLIVFGGIALAGPLLPGWISGAMLGPAFVLALGVALVVAGLRRPGANGSGEPAPQS